jgi:UDP-glucose 4-epimerase
VRRLAAEGARAVIVDLVPPPVPLEPSIEAFVQGDIRSPEVLDRAFSLAPVDAVVHLAAYKSVEESVRDPGRYFDNNVGGSLCLLEAMRRAAVEALVFSSTCAVYGTTSVVPVTEQSPVVPESPYVASKAMA